MKTKLTLFCVFLTFMINAQHAFFIHVALPENSSGNLTFMDHPLLNNNPDAHIIITHNYSAGNPNGINNNNVSGLFYSNAIQRWAIFNENQNPIVNESAYHVYVENGPQAFVHIAAGDSPESIIDNGLMNGNPGANAVFSNYYNPFSVYNNINYGLLYAPDINRWIIYSESGHDIPNQAAFFFVGGENKNSDVINFNYEATASDINQEYIRINHPFLNNNPDAIFVISHNWGIEGDTSNVIVNSPVGVDYDPNNQFWYVFRDSGSAEAGTKFNFMMDSAFLSVETQNTIVTSIYPNPTSEKLNIQADVTIDYIEIYNTLGQHITTEKVDANKATVNVEYLNNGVYILKTFAGNKASVDQFVKK